MAKEEHYIDFDEYIRQGEPEQREAAYAWSTAIGLQAVDGLTTSEYLNDLARRNIEGEITIDEVGTCATATSISLPQRNGANILIRIPRQVPRQVYYTPIVKTLLG